MAVEFPRFLQTKQYSAKLLRDVFLDAAIQPGVVGGTDLMVTQRGAGANMSVDVAAGAGWVKGTSSVRQGMYNVYNDATVNVTITAANATNPRIDQIILRVYDSTDGGSAQDIGAVEVVTGTPTAGATLNNRTGVGALPAHSIVIADVLVGAAAASISNAVIRDRRPFARGFYAATTQLGVGTADYTIVAGTGYTLIDSTNLQFRVECTGNPIRILWHGTGRAAVTETDYTVMIDGVATWGALTAFSPTSGAAQVELPGVMTLPAAPSAGSHLIGMAWKGTGGTSVLYRNSNYPLTFGVEEIVRPNVVNNSVTTG